MYYAPIRADRTVEAFEAVAPPTATGLTLIERQVVVLSLRDRGATVAPAGRVRQWWRTLFGVRPVNPLADPRLEMLRMFCVRYRLGRHDAAFAMMAAAGAVGLSRDTLSAARALVDGLVDARR